MTVGGNPDPVVKLRDRREVVDKHQKVIGIFAPADKGDDTFFPVVEIDPFKSRVLEIDLPERPFFVVKTV